MDIELGEIESARDLAIEEAKNTIDSTELCYGNTVCAIATLHLNYSKCSPNFSEAMRQAMNEVERIYTK